MLDNVWQSACLVFVEILDGRPTYQLCAYLDPGTGSMIIQVLLAGILGAGFAIKIFWYKIKSFFSTVFGKGAAATSKAEDIAAQPENNERGKDE